MANIARTDASSANREYAAAIIAGGHGQPYEKR
jgi:hypothetical protein